MKRFYKLIEKEEDRSITSLFSNFNDYSIVYKVNKWIDPFIGKIFIFPTVYDVELFIKDLNLKKDNIRCYICEVENPVEISKVCIYGSELYQKFWKIYNCKNFIYRKFLEFKNRDMFSEISKITDAKFYVCDKIKLLNTIKVG